MRKRLGFAAVLSLILLHPALSVSESLDAYCEVSCGGGTSVSCSAGSCTAVDRNCPDERGSVTCGSTTTYCPATCPSGLDCSSFNHGICTYSPHPSWPDCCVASPPQCADLCVL